MRDQTTDRSTAQLLLSSSAVDDITSRAALHRRASRSARLRRVDRQAEHAAGRDRLLRHAF